MFSCRTKNEQLSVKIMSNDCQSYTNNKLTNQGKQWININSGCKILQNKISKNAYNIVAYFYHKINTKLKLISSLSYLTLIKKV